VVRKERTGRKLHKSYDRGQTPYQRVLSCPEVSEEVKAALQKTFVSLNAVALRKRIDNNLQDCGGGLGNPSSGTSKEPSVTVTTEVPRSTQRPS